MPSGSDLAIDAMLDAALGEDTDTIRTMTSNTDEKITIWSTQTGEAKPVLRIDARRVLRKKLPGGALAHWMPGMPGDQPKARQGTIRCYLHPDFDESDGVAKLDRAWVDQIGLADVFCNSGNPANRNRDDFRSVLMRDRHMRYRHRDEWQIIQDARETAERTTEAAERRADREVTLSLARGLAGAQAAPVAVENVQCGVADCDYVNTQANVNRHKAQAHKE